MKTTFIYALCEPGTRTVRYLGKSDAPENRLLEHIKYHSIKMGTHLGNWIRSLNSKEPSLVIIKEIPCEGWQEEEVRYIRAARMLGMDLVNSTDGGDGVTMTPEIKAKIGAKNRGKIHTPESLANMSAAHMGYVTSDETKAKLKITSTGQIKSPETIAKLQAAWTPERQAKMSERVSGKNHHYFGKKRSPETCAKISKSLAGRKGSNMSKETREKISSALRGKPKTPEHCAAMALGKIRKGLL